MGLFVIGYLLVASIFSTCYLGTIKYSTMSGTTEFNHEHTFFMRDNFLIHLAIFFIFSCFLLIYRKKTFKRFINWKVLGRIAIFVMASLTIYIVLAGGGEPRSDQRHVIESAVGFYTGDYSALEPGGYIFLYPHQFGVTLFYWGLCILFGGLNNTGFQIVNAALIIFSYIFLAKLSGLIMKDDKRADGRVLTVALLFSPYLFYSTFLYGTVVGFFFAIISYYCMVLFVKNEGRNLLLVTGSICMAISVLVRSNYLIFFIAAMIYLAGIVVGNIQKNRKVVYRGLLFGMLMAGCCFAVKWGSNQYLAYLNGGEKIEGLPMITYVAMGLQESKAAPGWYNGYNYTVYVENQFVQESTKAAARKEIREIISRYPQDITASISFFIKKIISQWNNPTYSSLDIIRERAGKNGLDWLVNGNRTRLIYIWIVNIIQTWILAGTFLYMLFRLKKCTWHDVLLPLTLLGGFLFHIFWEAKNLYVTSYFILLLPICIWGYEEWRDLLSNKKVSRRKACMAGLCVLLIWIASNTTGFQKIFARTDDEGVFNIYTFEVVDQDRLAEILKE